MKAENIINEQDQVEGWSSGMTDKIKATCKEKSLDNLFK